MVDIPQILQQLRVMSGHDGRGVIDLPDYLDLFDHVFVNYRDPEVRFLRELCKQILWNADGYSYNHLVNGEHALIRRLARLQPTVVFDVGANLGQWSGMALSAFGSARIHAFEIVPATFAALAGTFAGEGRIVLNDFGLFDRSGSITVYSYASEGQLSSCIPRENAESALDGRVTTGDEYMERHGIDHIDFLKIDTEGADHHVIAGFSRALERKKISLLQFEYGRVSIHTKHLLKDYYDVLRGYGFSIGKLRHDGVDFKEYSEFDETFLGPNFVACLAERQDIIACVGVP